MNLRNRHRVIASFFIVLLSTSMTIFTLHSHHHIEWNKAPKHTHTGTNLSIDSSDCPICGYLFSADHEPAFTAECLISDFHLVCHLDTHLVDKAFITPVLGRSPPFIS